MLRVMLEETRLPMRRVWGRPLRESRTRLLRCVLRPRWSSLVASFMGGGMVLKEEL